jgi:hypothetical protein
MTILSSDDDLVISPAEWHRRQAKAIEVIARHVTDRGQQLEMLDMLGLLPVAEDDVA